MDEFAQHGIAGARVDRIAAGAGCNKAMIYAYFGSKEGLFDALLKIQVDRLVASAPVTPEDLPGYAGRLFDAYASEPRLLRLVAYHRLGNGFGDVPKADVEAVAKAQREGRVSAEFSASDLLGMVVHLSILAFTTPNATRELVERSVRRLVGQ